MASVKVPELDLELASGTLGGLVTTVEGLITKISESKFTLTHHKIFEHVAIFSVAPLEKFLCGCCRS